MSAAANINRGAPATWTDGVLHASGNLLTADADGIKLSVASSLTDVVYGLADFDGALVVDDATAVPRCLTITTAGVGAFTVGSEIVISWRDYLDRPFVDVLTLTAANGETLRSYIPGHLSLADLTIAIEGQADDDGTITIGASVSKVVDADWILGVTEGTISCSLVDALDTTIAALPVGAGVALPVSVATVHSVTSAEFLAMRAAAR